MSIFIKPVQRGNPSDKTAAKKWFFVQKTMGIAEEAEVADLMADETTLNPSEARMAIRQFRKVLERLLQSGRSVRLGDFGIFSTTLNSKGCGTLEELTALNIAKVKMNFRPGEDLKAAMQKVTFVRLDKLSTADGTGNGGNDRPDEV